MATADDDPDSRAGPSRGKPRIGVDEWVASHEGRREGGAGIARHGPRAARADARSRRSSPRSASPRRLVPLFTNNDYVIRVGFDTLLYMLLALGLNIAVGYAGLLDLGYVAFYGFGAYVYAMLASDKFGQHWPTRGDLPGRRRSRR